MTLLLPLIMPLVGGCPAGGTATVVRMLGDYDSEGGLACLGEFETWWSRSARAIRLWSRPTGGLTSLWAGLRQPGPVVSPVSLVGAIAADEILCLAGEGGTSGIRALQRGDQLEVTGQLVMERSMVPSRTT